jgi:hypothetical protein
MDGMEPIVQAPTAGLARQGSFVAGIFLHAGWRSCGTWMWERLRESPAVRGFYEPLHEDLARLKLGDIGLFRPDSWKSGHGTGAPYFAEFAPLLRPARGVQGHDARFAFDRYFASGDKDDRDLEAYLRGLMAEAAAENRVPVMKFCRSLGRVGWMEARFPDVFHAVILRDPEAQWLSGRRQMEQNKNRYFVLAPFVILARNADHPLLAEAAAWLGVKMPPRFGPSLGLTTDACWRHVQRLSWRDRYRGFLALWVASGVTALEGGARLIDSDRLGADPAYRVAAEGAFEEAAGLKVCLSPDDTSEGRGQRRVGNPEEWRDAARAKEAALGFLRANAHRLAPARAAMLAQKLAPEPGWQCPDVPGAAPGTARQPGPADYLDAAAYVALARGSYPLRRAHYHVRRWLKLV